MASLTIQIAAAVLCGKTMLLSPLTAFYRFQSGKFIAKEDTKGNKKASVGVDFKVERVRHAQRNALENILISVLLFAINAKAAYAHDVFKIITAARILHTIFYLKGLQPFRAIAFMVGMACNLFMIYQTYTTGNAFNKALALLLLKVQVMSPLSGFTRMFAKAPRREIAEDAKLMKVDKPAQKNSARVERVCQAHLNDLYTVIPFVILAMITKQAGILKMAEINVFCQWFLYARICHTLCALVGLPYLLQSTALLGGFAVHMMMLLPWNLHKKFDFHRKSHLLVALMFKVVLFTVFEQLFRLFKGQFGPSKEELEEPEKFQETETTRISNLLRNDAENVLTTVALIMVIRFVNIPHNFIYIYCIARLAHSVVYFLHVPQPSRALAWAVGLVFSLRMAILAF